MRRKVPYQIEEVLNDQCPEVDIAWRDALAGMDREDILASRKLADRTIRSQQIGVKRIFNPPYLLITGLVLMAALLAVVFVWSDSSQSSEIAEKLPMRNIPENIEEETEDQIVHNQPANLSENQHIAAEHPVSRETSQESAEKPGQKVIGQSETPNQPENKEDQEEALSQSPDKKNEAIPEFSTNKKHELTGSKLTAGHKSAANPLTGNISVKGVQLMIKENLWVYEQKVDGKDAPVGFDYAASDMPAYPGGDGKLLEDLRYEIGQIQLSEEEKMAKPSVILSLTISAKGLIEETKIIGKTPATLERKIHEALTKIGPWTKGKKTGKKGSVLYQLSITFAQQ